jgi:hypothetical protein
MKQSASMIQSENIAEEVEKLAQQENNQDLQRMLRAAKRIGNSKDAKVVPRESLQAFLEGQIWRKQECMKIPFTILYFLFFGVMLLGHERTVDLSQVEREFRGMMEGTSFEGPSAMTFPAFTNPVPVSGHKTMGDIDVIQDVYTYMQDALIPLFVQNGADTMDQHRVLSYNQLIGGLVFQQSRKQKLPCATEFPNMGPFDSIGVNPLLADFDCFPGDKTSDACFGPGNMMEGFCPQKLSNASRRLKALHQKWEEEQENPSMFGYLRSAFQDVRDTLSSFSISPGAASPGAAKGKPGRRLSASAHAARSRMGKKAKQQLKSENIGDVFTVIFHEYEGMEAAQQKLGQLKDNVWIDEQTMWVGIRVFVLNPDLGVMCSATVNVYFAPSGEIVTYLVANSFLVEPYEKPSLYILDSLWFVLWLHLGFTTIMSLVKAKKSKAVKAYFLNWRNIVEWCSFLGGIVIIGLFFSYLGQLGNLKDQAVDLATKRPDQNPSQQVLEDYGESLETLQKTQSDFDSFMDEARTIYGFYTMFIMIRFLRAFEAQPRLRVVTQTIFDSLPDLAHFFIVFGMFLAAFGASAMMLFGHRLVEYASFVQAFFQVSQIAIGNFDFMELAEDNIVTTIFWFTVFIILLFLIMFNMILAIIMDTYSAAKAASAATETIWVQSHTLVMEIFDRDRVSAPELLRVVEQMGVEYIGVNSLMEACPSIKEEQVHALLDFVEQAEKHEDEQALNISDATRLIMSIRLQVHSISQTIYDIRAEQKKGKDFEEQQKRVAQQVGETVDPSKPIILRLDDDAEKRIRGLEGRLDVLEEFLNEAMSYMVFRGKEVRNRLKAMEEFLRGQRDTGGTNDASDWNFRGMGEMGAPVTGSTKWSMMSSSM